MNKKWKKYKNSDWQALKQRGNISIEQLYPFETRLQNKKTENSRKQKKLLTSVWNGPSMLCY